MSLRNLTNNAPPGSLLVSGFNNNNTPLYVQPILTNFPGFPSSFVNQGGANLVVNNTGDGVAFVAGSTLAKSVTEMQQVAVADTLTTQIKFTNNVVGSLSYNPSTGDVLLSQSGWYSISTQGFLRNGNNTVTGIDWYLAITDGAGVATTVLARIQNDGRALTFPLNYIGFFTAPVNIGLFVENNSGSACDTGETGNTENFLAVKYMW